MTLLFSSSSESCCVLCQYIVWSSVSCRLIWRPTAASVSSRVRYHWVSLPWQINGPHRELPHSEEEEEDGDGRSLLTVIFINKHAPVRTGMWLPVSACVRLSVCAINMLDSLEMHTLASLYPDKTSLSHTLQLRPLWDINNILKPPPDSRPFVFYQWQNRYSTAHFWATIPCSACAGCGWLLFLAPDMRVRMKGSWTLHMVEHLKEMLLLCCAGRKKTTEML